MERFWRKVDKGPGHGPGGDCWLWTAGVFRSRGGYGAFWLNGHMERAHRVAWVLTHGPTDLMVLHRCDTPLCVRPDHLFVGDHDTNMADMRAKNRQTQMRDMPIEIRGPLGCHIWTGATSKRGYPVRRHEGKIRHVRRIIYTQAKAGIPPAHRVDMDCGERACVNPLHMVCRPRYERRAAMPGPPSR